MIEDIPSLANIVLECIYINAVGQQGMAGPGIDYGNFVDPASLNFNQFGPYYQTNADYFESYWKGIPRPGYRKVSVPNIGIMVTPRDSNWDLATTKQQLARLSILQELFVLCVYGG